MNTTRNGLHRTHLKCVYNVYCWEHDWDIILTTIHTSANGIGLYMLFGWVVFILTGLSSRCWFLNDWKRSQEITIIYTPGYMSLLLLFRHTTAFRHSSSLGTSRRVLCTIHKRITRPIFCREFSYTGLNNIHETIVHRPPLLVRIGIVATSVGLATPLFALGGIWRIWYFNIHINWISNIPI